MLAGPHHRLSEKCIEHAMKKAGAPHTPCHYSSGVKWYNWLIGSVEAALLVAVTILTAGTGTAPMIFAVVCEEGAVDAAAGAAAAGEEAGAVAVSGGAEVAASEGAAEAGVAVLEQPSRNVGRDVARLFIE